MSKNKCLAIIPARGGSKRIPRKNIRELLGKPIIAYSIEAAVNSELFQDIMVSTEDMEIAEVARKYGADIPFLRSEKNADDFAITAEVLSEVLGDYKIRGKVFDYICCIYPTALFVTALKLKETYNIMIEKEADGVIPVVKFGYPIQRALRINLENKLEYIWPENIDKRSQDLGDAYHDAGQFYWIKVASLIKNKSLITSYSLPIIFPAMEVQDIDNEEDWKLAEIKMKRFINEKV